MPAASSHANGTSPRRRASVGAPRGPRAADWCQMPVISPAEPAPAVAPTESSDLPRALAGFVTLYLAIGALSPYLPVYYESLGLPLDAIGLLTAMYAGAAMVGAPGWGSMADRVGAARPVLAVAATLATVASLVLGIADGVLLVALAALALALAMSGIMPILDARALEIATERNSQYAGMRVWGSAAYIVGVLVTGWIAEQVGIRGMFLVLVPHWRPPRWSASASDHGPLWRQ
jgi:MFS transporter, PPP family, 3-phenylpropionic acid transporter